MHANLKIMKRFIFPLIISALLTSCKTNTVKPPVSVTAPFANSAAFYKEITRKADFNQVKINSRVDVQTGSTIPTLDATIYVENGRKVWMNMIAVFFNVGRGIATPTGIKGYEKWNKTYIESDFSYLNKMLNVNFIDYSALQNLLLGRTFIPVNEQDFVLTQNPQGYLLSSAKNLKFANGGKISEYNVAMQYSENLDLNSVKLKNAASKDELEVNYSNWIALENLRLPKNVKINIKGNKQSQILLENTKFDTSKMETPYSVPNNYTKTEIR